MKCKKCGKQIRNKAGACECTFEIKKETALDQWKSFLTEQGVEWREEVSLIKNHILLIMKTNVCQIETKMTKETGAIFIRFNPDGSLYRGEVT